MIYTTYDQFEYNSDAYRYARLEIDNLGNLYVMTCRYKFKYGSNLHDLKEFIKHDLDFSKHKRKSIIIRCTPIDYYAYVWKDTTYGKNLIDQSEAAKSLVNILCKLDKIKSIRKLLENDNN